MELTQADAYLVLRTAYKSGLLDRILKSEEGPDIHIPGTSFRQDKTAKLAALDFEGMEAICEFLALLIDAVRKERDA